MTRKQDYRDYDDHLIFDHEAGTVQVNPDSTLLDRKVAQPQLHGFELLRVPVVEPPSPRPAANEEAPQ